MITKPEKYTREFVLNELNDMLVEIDRDQGIFFINQLFEKRDYSRQRYSDWAKKFDGDEEIMDTIKRLEGQLENRLVIGALTGALNPTMSIFTLKNKHDWKDRTEVENTHEIKTALVKFIDEKPNRSIDSKGV